ncbi:MAG: proton-conducting transporter membrane subunit [Microbacteriaceae bacterium]
MKTESVSLIARVATVVTAAGFLGSSVIGVLALTTDTSDAFAASTLLRLDALAVIMTILVLGLSTLIQAFALRYLRGDTRQLWFVVSANLLTAATVVMVCAETVALFALAWVGAGAALVLLLATYWPAHQAREGVRRTGIRFVIADTAFLAGVVIVLIAGNGDIPFSKLANVAGTVPLPVQLALALLLVTAALARSSQIPFHGWLPFTLAAPTPVSALLHAGVVNAGAILLIRFAPAIAVHTTVMTIIFLAGVATLVYASSMRLVRPDVKGRLVFSTMAQMGFMIMACGLGLFAAAIFHLVAHSLFKSALFLGAGKGVRNSALVRDRPTPLPQSRLIWVAALTVSVAVPVAALVGAKLVFSSDITAASIGLLVFVALTASVALASALTTHFSVRTVTAGIVSTVALALFYVAFLDTFTASIPSVTAIAPAPAWLLIVPAAGLLAVQLLARNPAPLARIAEFIYARSLSTQPFPRSAAVARAPRTPTTTQVKTQPTTTGVHS